MASNPIQDLLALGLRDFEHNTTAHVPKISWPFCLERALDLLTLASMLHRRLDAAHVTEIPANRLVLLSQQASQSTSLPRQGNVEDHLPLPKGLQISCPPYDGAPP